MALIETGGSGGDFLPYVGYVLATGKMTINKKEKGEDGNYVTNVIDIAFPKKFIFDLENVEVGWVKFTPKGPIGPFTKYGNELPQRPEKDYDAAVRLKIYDKENGLVSFMSSSKMLHTEFNKLHEQFINELPSNKGKVPVVQIAKTNKVQIKTDKGVKTFQTPDWKIVAWVDRPEALDAKPEQKQESAFEESDDENPFA